MWQKGDFDLKTIKKELALAKNIGLNSIRVFMQYIIWKDDPNYFKKSIEEFSKVADQIGLKIMWVLFDDVVFPVFGGRIEDPYLGKQRDPIPGLHNSCWTPSPGWSYVRNPSSWSDLEDYLKDVMGHFANDKRILLWDLYNEPNSTLWPKGNPFLLKVFKWAREINPSQPLTVGYHVHLFFRLLNKIIRNNVDITSFHNYFSPFLFKLHISQLRKLRRPLLCTEWLFRPVFRNSVKKCLPLMKKENIGCFHWGLVNGKTQTNLSWFAIKSFNWQPKKWQQDLFYPNYNPYDINEIKLFKKYTGQSGKN
ncbi:MAG: cellulase family glycosylhydrolase [Candidatus Helarchaeota archaeon]|nr:cellulase family glycosylhydrolase [Candidatus Helarchaeota archaeon]